VTKSRKSTFLAKEQCAKLNSTAVEVCNFNSQYLVEIYKYLRNKM